MLQQTLRPALYLTDHLQQAETVAEDLAAFLPSVSVEVYPPAEVLPYEYYAESPELTAQRLKVLTALVRGERTVVVAPLAALTRRLPPPAVFSRSGLEVAPGMILDREELLARLVELGYRRVERVEARAEFAARGDIVDIFPLPAAYPYRLELFDNEVDSIREFDRKVSVPGPVLGRCGWGRLLKPACLLPYVNGRWLICGPQLTGTGRPHGQGAQRSGGEGPTAGGGVVGADSPRPSGTPRKTNTVCL